MFIYLFFIYLFFIYFTVYIFTVHIFTIFKFLFLLNQMTFDILTFLLAKLCDTLWGVFGIFCG